MLLSDRDIRAELDAGRVALDPYDAQMVQPASIDVRLDRWFRLFDNHRYSVIDPSQAQEDLTHLVDVGPDEAFVLHPGEFVLGSTYERVTLPDDVAARLEGKSSLGRLGLLTHTTAGFIDPGFTGHVTLELSNTATMPILLWPGMKVGQLCFFRLSSPALAPYGQGASGSRYQGQRGPTASRSYQGFHRIRVPEALGPDAPAVPGAAPAPGTTGPAAAPDPGAAPGAVPAPGAAPGAASEPGPCPAAAPAPGPEAAQPPGPGAGPGAAPGPGAGADAAPSHTACPALTKTEEERP